VGPARQGADGRVARPRGRHGGRARRRREPLPARGEARGRARARASVPPLMARSWRELFVTGADGAAAPEAEAEEERRGFFARLRDNMAKSGQALGAELQSTVLQSLEHETWERREETLICADV